MIGDGRGKCLPLFSTAGEGGGIVFVSIDPLDIPDMIDDLNIINSKSINSSGNKFLQTI